MDAALDTATAIARLEAYNREQDAEILRQHRRIEALERQLQRLEARLTDLADRPGSAAPEPPPPHY